MRLSSAVDQFFKDRENFLAAETRRKYRRVLDDLVALASMRHSNNVVAFTPQVTREFFIALANKGLAPSTLASYRAAIAEFAEWCVLLRYVADNPLREVPEVRVPRGLPRPFSSDAVRAIMALPLSHPDLMLRGLLYDAGLRVAEVSGLRVRDVDFGDGELDGVLRITGKGSKTRIVPLTPALWHLLRDYMLAHCRVTDLDSWVMSKPHGGRLTEQAIRVRTRRWGRQANVDKVTPHRFRHTFATELLRQTGNVRVVQEILGHESIATTQRYTAVSPEQVRAAMRQRTNIPIDLSHRHVPDQGS